MSIQTYMGLCKEELLALGVFLFSTLAPELLIRALVLLFDDIALADIELWAGWTRLAIEMVALVGATYAALNMYYKYRLNKHRGFKIKPK